MSSELVLRTGTDVPASFAEQMQMARALAESTLLPRHLQRNPANVLLILQAARALNVTAFWAFQSIHVIDGKTTIAAELMRALIIREGHEFRVVESSKDRAVVRIKRKDREEPYVTEFTIEDAREAGLLNKTNWKSYRKAMLVARATSKAAREECPDVLFGHIYSPEELGALVDADGSPILDKDGRPVIDGEVVEPLGEQEVAEYAARLMDTEVTELTALWKEIVDRGGARARTGPDETLADVLIKRLTADADMATTRQRVRDIWALAQVLRIQDKSFFEYLKERGNALPGDGKPSEGAAQTPQDGAGAPNGARTGDYMDSDPKVATEHAQRLQEAARESWGDEPQGALGGEALEGEVVQ